LAIGIAAAFRVWPQASEVARDWRLEHQVHAVRAEPANELPAVFDGPEQRLAFDDSRDRDPAHGPGRRWFSKTVTGSFRALDRSSAISTAYCCPPRTVSGLRGSAWNCCDACLVRMPFVVVRITWPRVIDLVPGGRSARRQLPGKDSVRIPFRIIA
jgi:hypothetical protein